MKRALIILAVAAMSFGGFRWISATLAPSVGQPLSESEALTICGGGTGAKEINCPSGSFCATGMYWVANSSNSNSADVMGQKYCGGNGTCGDAYNGEVAGCVGGGG